MLNPKSKIHNLKSDDGSILIYTIVIIFIFSLVMLGVLAYATIQLRVTRSAVYDQQAFQIAEAGENYYQWHLAHFPNDFWDGNASSTPGPYVHNYVDTDTGQVIGTSERVVVSIRLGDPDEGLFKLPTGLKSLSPSEMAAMQASICCGKQLSASELAPLQQADEHFRTFRFDF